MATQNSVNVGLSGSTGTVNFVGSTSPTLVTPTLGAALATSIQISNTGIIDTNGKVALALSATASAVNGFTITNAATGGGPQLSVTGSDSNIIFNYKTKGSSGHYFYDGNGNILFNTSTIASSVNYTTIQNAATGGSPTIFAAGTDSNVILQIKGQGTGGVTILGTTAADNAAAGYVGELLSSANATAVAMTNATVTQIQTLSLTAGDWDVWATFYTTVTGTTVNSIVECQCHTSTATIAAPTTAQLASIASLPGLNVTGQATYICTGISRWNVSGSTTVYLNATATYSASTLTGNGAIYARRVR